jgi:hypothetical protein
LDFFWVCERLERKCLGYLLRSALGLGFEVIIISNHRFAPPLAVREVKWVNLVLLKSRQQRPAVPLVGSRLKVTSDDVVRQTKLGSDFVRRSEHVLRGLSDDEHVQTLVLN